MVILNNEPHYTIKEISERFQVDHTTVRLWMRKRQIGFMKMVGRVLVSQTDLDAFVAKVLESKQTPATLSAVKHS